MAILRQRAATFRPVTLTLETQVELDALRNILTAAQPTMIPASPEDLMINNLLVEMRNGIRPDAALVDGAVTTRSRS